MTLLLALALCAHPGIGAENDADTFIAAYNKQYMALYYASSQAEWEANTRIVEGDIK